MRALVVLAHPLPQSLCAHLAMLTVERLQARGIEVDLLDLYGESFSPVLTAGERASYSGDYRAEPDALALQARLARAEILVLVFPTWWFSMPAILKGWFDRVWSPGFAFAPGTPIKPLLKSLKTAIAVTTLGSPWWIDRLVLRQPVKRVLKTALLGACARQAAFSMLSLHGAEDLSAEQVAGFTKRIERELDRL